METTVVPSQSEHLALHCTLQLAIAKCLSSRTQPDQCVLFLPAQLLLYMSLAPEEKIK